jgi:hypothetical protein
LPEAISGLLAGKFDAPMTYSSDFDVDAVMKPAEQRVKGQTEFRF